MISTAAGLLGGKCGAPTYGVVVAVMLAQAASRQVHAASSTPLKTAARLLPTAALAAALSAVSSAAVRACRCRWVRAAACTSVRIESLMVKALLSYVRHLEALFQSLVMAHHASP